MRPAGAPGPIGPLIGPPRIGPPRIGPPLSRRTRRYGASRRRVSRATPTRVSTRASVDDGRRRIAIPFGRRRPRSRWRRAKTSPSRRLVSFSRRRRDGNVATRAAAGSVVVLSMTNSARAATLASLGFRRVPLPALAARAFPTPFRRNRVDGIAVESRFSTLWTQSFGRVRWSRGCGGVGGVREASRGRVRVVLLGRSGPRRIFVSSDGRPWEFWSRDATHPRARKPPRSPRSRSRAEL